MAEIIRAPWTPEQVAALNEFQRNGGMHPFTCGGDHTPGSPVLVAREDGWHCPEPYGEPCDYQQDWAHAFMADPTKWPAPWPRTPGRAPQEPDAPHCARCGQPITGDRVREWNGAASNGPGRSWHPDCHDTEQAAHARAATEATDVETTTRVIALYEQWVKAGPPPLGTSIARWWDARLVELHDAIVQPAERSPRTTANNYPTSSDAADNSQNGPTP